MRSGAGRRQGRRAFTCSFPRRRAACTASSIPRSPVREEAAAQLEIALELLREATGAPVAGHVGSADPTAAIADALNDRTVHEIIISTLPRRVSRWMHIDLPSKVRGMGLPVTHVEATHAPAEEDDPQFAGQAA